MGEFVKKTRLGYKEVDGGHSDPDCTHVILTVKEYNGLLRDISQAEQATREEKIRAEDEKRESARELQSMIQEYEQTIEEWREALDAEVAESAHQKELNENLLRISKERANVDRKLKPKKEHTGYCVVISGEKGYRYKAGYRSWEEVRLWETVIQSPYTIDMPEEVVRKQISDELLHEDDAGGSLISRLGIDACYKGSYPEMIYDTEWNLEPRGDNIAFEFFYQMNGRYGYWEVKFYHTTALQAIPHDMRLR